MEDLKIFNKSVPKKKAKEILEVVDSNGWNKTDYQRDQNESVISFINSLEHIEVRLLILIKPLIL